MYIKQERQCFIGISVHREDSWKYDEQRSIFDEIRSVWIADETLSRVFDISFQSTQKLRSKRRSIIVTLVIFCVLTWWIINEFEKYASNQTVPTLICDYWQRTLREKLIWGHCSHPLTGRLWALTVWVNLNPPERVKCADGPLWCASWGFTRLSPGNSESYS